MISSFCLQPKIIGIVAFKIIKGQINSPFDFEIEKVKGHTFHVDFELGFNLDDKLVKADFSVNVETNGKEENIEEAIGAFSFVYFFLKHRITANTGKRTKL